MVGSTSAAERGKKAFNIRRCLAPSAEDKASNRIKSPKPGLDRSNRTSSRTTKLAINLPSLGSILSRQALRPPGNRFTTVMEPTVGAVAGMQSLELEQQLTLRTINGKREHKIRDQALTLTKRHARSSSAPSLRDTGSKQAVHLGAAAHAHLSSILSNAPFQHIVLRSPPVTR